MPIRITSAINGFRRAGVAHTTAPTTYPDQFFTEQQLAQLEAEPRLVVEHIDADEITDPATDSQGTVEPDSVPGTVDTISADEITDPAADSQGTVEPDSVSGTVDTISADEITDPATDSQGILEPDSVMDATLAGVVDPDGTQRNLEDMKVAELRELATEMEINGAASLRKAELVEAIKAETVQINSDQEPDA